MANNFLITGYWGEPHVTAENDRGINAAMFGTGRFVLPVGDQFKAEYIGNNTIRMYDGKLMDNGAAAGIPAGEYVDLLIANAGQGMKRNDLIVFQYSQDASTMIESGTFVVVQGTETSGTAVDPVLTQSDLLTNKASFDQMALYRVSVSGTAISAPVKVFNVYQRAANIQDQIDSLQDQINNMSGTGSSGMVREFNSGAISVTSYTTPGANSKVYIVTVLIAGTAYSVTVDWMGLKAAGGSRQFGIAAVIAGEIGIYTLTATLNNSTTATFTVSSGNIVHVCGYY